VLRLEFSITSLFSVAWCARSVLRLTLSMRARRSGGRREPRGAVAGGGGRRGRGGGGGGRRGVVLLEHPRGGVTTRRGRTRLQRGRDGRISRGDVTDESPEGT
jgi:hypothetical protein